ncbi:hypothetical protein BLI708_02685 [Bifidobacterium imperatoris]|uniref:Thymidine phosphorylase n=1 Tax=Bifidobacterium imperatoris TaxID=2020965 RepID=A0A2N5IQ85_9BIFI|nr:hypothetical protein [Bifidobacterium imperatoris]PLS24110.1 hypothetical protein Tam1G_1838 [Bifidobacterium imperatoris]QSY58229.1 hypothetical protein BLI708_02685 [Bifidobacterium imperatoris]
MSTRPAFPDSSNSSAAAAAAHAASHGSGLGPGFGSLRAAGAAFSPARMGSLRPSRPAQLDPAVADGLAGGMDPQALSEMSHLSAAALLDRVRHSEDPEVVQRVLTLVETVGVDEIAELWSDAEPDSLPGVLWRLYMLRTWMRNNRDSIAQLWRLGEPVATTASAIAGVDQAPTEDDIVRLADSILSGAFVGDFAVALERAAAFTDVVALGLRVAAKRSAPAGAELTAKQTGDATHPATRAARLLHTSANLMTTARTFEQGAHLWRRGRLE